MLLMLRIYIQMPACHPQAEKSRIWQDNLKPKRENRILTHEAKDCVK